MKINLTLIFHIFHILLLSFESKKVDKTDNEISTNKVRKLYIK